MGFGIAGRRLAQAQVAVWLESARAGRRQKPDHARFDPASLDTLTIHAARDTLLIAPHEVNSHCFFVVRGCLRTIAPTPRGRRIEAFFLPGSVVGLSQNAAHELAVEAVTSCTLRLCARVDLDARAARDPACARWRTDEIMEQSVQAQFRHLMAYGRTADERLQAFLRDIAARLRADERRIGLPMDRTDIADHLGLTEVEIDDALSRLRAAGVVGLVGEHVRIERSFRRWLMQQPAGPSPDIA